MFTERDYARKVILKGKASRDTTVGNLMVREVLYVNLSDKVEHCMALMTDKHLRHLPVMEKGKLVGLVSIGDVVKSIIRDQEFTIRELERYISGA
jgi:signal-transduction protein with cAMP-binding, CBS, and nucleotidyltransferase domain